MWKSGGLERGKIYADLSNFLGRDYHTGEVNTQEEAENVIRILNAIRAKGNA